MVLVAAASRAQADASPQGAIETPALSASHPDGWPCAPSVLAADPAGLHGHTAACPPGSPALTQPPES